MAKTLAYRTKQSPCVLSTIIQLDSGIVGMRVELKALDGTIIGYLYMYSDALTFDHDPYSLLQQ